MKSPIFNIIKDFLITQKEFSNVFVLKTTKAQADAPSKQYYMQPLERTSAALNILNKKWQCKEHHISIYEDQMLAEKRFLSTYHYTALFQNQNEQITVRVYFDHNGEYLYTLVKDNTEKRIEISSAAEEKQIRIYAETVCSHTMTNLQMKIYSITEEFEQKFRNNLELLEKISIDLPNPTMDVLKKYIAQIEVCLIDCTNLEIYTYVSVKHYRKKFNIASDFIQKKLKTLKTQSKKEKQIIIEEIDKQSTENTDQKNSKQTLSHEELLRLQREQRSNDIKKALAGLQDIELSTDQLIQQHELLQEQFKLAEDFDLIVSTMSKITKLKRVLIDKMIQYVEKEDISTVKKLMPHVDIIFPPIIFKMAAKGHINLVEMLIKHYRFNLNRCNVLVTVDSILDPMGFMCDTLLLTAISHDQYDMFLWLIANGANPNIPNFVTGETPLIRATSENKMKYMHVLLDNHADIDVYVKPSNIRVMVPETYQEIINKKMELVEDTRKTALYIACWLKNVVAVKVLLSHQADPHIPAKNGYSAYMSMILNEELWINPVILTLFFDAGVNVDERHPDNRMTGLYFACQKNRLQDVIFFMMHGADPNLPTVAIASVVVINQNLHQLDQQSSRLFKPLQRSETNQINKALCHELKGKNKTEFTPLSKAAQKGHTEIVHFLITQQRTPVTVENAYNAFQIARYFGNLECAKLLNDHFKFSNEAAIAVKLLTLTS